MPKKVKRFVDAGSQWFWCEYEHPEYGTTKVTFRWEPSGRGTYWARIDSVEFDLFTPMEVQDWMMGQIDQGRFHMIEAPREEDS